MLIEEAKSKIQVKESYTKEDAIEILRTIDNILKENGFSHNFEDDIYEYQLFHLGLNSKKIDCDNSTIIYLSIADALNLPLFAVPAFHHVFIRFEYEGGMLNWETMDGREHSDNYYIRWRKISKKSIKNGVYLRELTLQESLGIVYKNRAFEWCKKRNHDRAIADYNEAIRLNPNDNEGFSNRGFEWRRIRNLDNAIADYNEALRLDPGHVHNYLDRARAFRDNGNLIKARFDYTRYKFSIFR